MSNITICKPTKCCWCGEMISAGSTAMLLHGGSYIAYMHNECHEAYKTMPDDKLDAGWDFHSFLRGQCIARPPRHHQPSALQRTVLCLLAQRGHAMTRAAIAADLDIPSVTIATTRVLDFRGWVRLTDQGFLITDAGRAIVRGT